VTLNHFMSVGVRNESQNLRVLGCFCWGSPVHLNLPRSLIWWFSLAHLKVLFWAKKRAVKFRPWVFLWWVSLRSTHSTALFVVLRVEILNHNKVYFVIKFQSVCFSQCDGFRYHFTHLTSSLLRDFTVQRLNSTATKASDEMTCYVTLVVVARPYL